MTEKEKVIIKSGMKLFAQKGFSSTSIQEIATESNISKGAFYLHFKSKDDLLLAILEYIFETIESSRLVFENQDLSAREKFIKQISAFFGTFIGHKEFLIMLSKEQAIPRNEEIKKLFFKKRFESHLLYRKGLVSIYGPDTETFSIEEQICRMAVNHYYYHNCWIVFRDEHETRNYSKYQHTTCFSFGGISWCDARTSS